MDLHTYEADLPAVPAGKDVVSQIFTASVGGVEVVSQELATDVTVSPQYEVQEGATVDLSCVHKDNAGNLSPARTQQYVATDTIPPDAPGEFGEVRLVSERTVPDAPPAPAPEPEPAPEEPPAEPTA